MHRKPWDCELAVRLRRTEDNPLRVSEGECVSLVRSAVHIHSTTPPSTMSKLTSARVLLFLSALLLGSVVSGTPTQVVAQTQCSFSGKLDISPEAIMLDSDPVQGNPSSEVLLIEFFDPNCEPCQRFNPILKKVMERYGDRIKYYMHPIPVWQYSTRQIAALLLAKEKGKYYEMIDLQFKNATKRGMNIEQLVALADSLNIDTEWMRSRLQMERMRKEVGRLSYQANKAGVRTTPTFAIGRKIISSSQPTSCIARLIERTLQDAEGE